MRLRPLLRTASVFAVSAGLTVGALLSGAATGASAIAAGQPASSSPPANRTPTALDGRSVASDSASACGVALTVNWPEPGTRIERIAHLAASPRGPFELPAHCELFGVMHERIGTDGQRYAIRFHLRLPDDWNGGFYFQGGGGAEGEVGDALGRIGEDESDLPFLPALARGYAVLSEDSGHDKTVNADPARGGVVAFGFDPQARADYGHSSLAPATLAAKAIATAYYHRAIDHAYFVGCSKGGQEGMVLAQQHPDLFDGIVAAAPAFSLPRVGLEEVHAMGRIAELVRKPGSAGIDVRDFHNSFSDAQLRRVASAVTDACDALDGLKDGTINNYAACTTTRVRPHLEAAVCTESGTTSDCLSRKQLSVLYDVMQGARRADGSQIYAPWSWDAGIAAPGWRAWKLGSADGKVPALNIVLSSASLHSVFTVPPTAVHADPQALLDAQLAFDLQRDGQRIYATGSGFSRSGWQDLSARSPDLSAFAARGGRLIVPHGVSDPAFSVKDTIAWWNEVNKAGGHAADYVRVFPVPGMNHCSGGPATDHYDAFAALVEWVEHRKAPDSLLGTAGSHTPWPGRQRPICAYPTYARYKGHGSPNDASSFSCVKPRTAS